MWQAVSSLGRVVQDWSMNYPSMKRSNWCQSESRYIITVLKQFFFQPCGALSLSLSLYIYIYICMYVCVWRILWYTFFFLVCAIRLYLFNLNRLTWNISLFNIYIYNKWIIRTIKYILYIYTHMHTRIFAEWYLYSEMWKK